MSKLWLFAKTALGVFRTLRLARVFTEDFYKTAKKNPIERICRLTLFRLPRGHARRKSESEFIHAHPHRLCNDKMPEFMGDDKYDENYDKYDDGHTLKNLVVIKKSIS